MAFQLTVELSTTVIKLRPGESSTFDVAIRNTGDVVEHFEVRFLGLPGDAIAELPSQPTKLRPRDSGGVSVTVALPPASSVHAGAYRVGVKVQSTVHAAVSRTAELTLAVLPVAGIAVTAHPEVIEGRRGGSFTVTARNSGNSPAPLTFAARDETGTAEISVLPESLTIPANNSASATVTVRAPGKLTGSDRQSRITVVATDARAPHNQAQAVARMVLKPLIPVAASRALGIVLVAAVAVGSILAGIYLSRGPTPAPAPNGAPTSIATSSEGDRPPAAPLLRLDPAAPVAGKPVTFLATLDDDVQELAWELISANGISIDTSSEKTFSYTFEPGNYQVKLVVSAPGGKATTRQPFVVTPEPPPVEQVTQRVTLLPNQALITEMTCPAGRAAVAGGVVDETGSSTEPFLRSSRPVGEPGQWRFSARSTSERTVRYVLVCIEPIPGLTRHTVRSDQPRAGVRTLRATCPVGTVVVGGGVAPLLPNAASLGHVRESVPSRDPTGAWTSWVATVDIDDALNTEVTVVCAPSPAGYEVVDVPNPLVVGSGEASGVAVCPGKVALGGGAGLASSVATPTASPLPTSASPLPTLAPPTPGPAITDQSRTDASLNILTSAPNLGMPGQMEHGWTAVVNYTTGSASQVHIVAICVELT